MIEQIFTSKNPELRQAQHVYVVKVDEEEKIRIVGKVALMVFAHIENPWLKLDTPEYQDCMDEYKKKLKEVLEILEKYE